MSISIHPYRRDLQEEDATFDLQCSDSLSIFANGIGDDVFVINKLLPGVLRGLLRCSRRGVKASLPK
jgi:hypothetical protein